ncbi:emp24p/erv25p- protein [Ascochyta rabiei]|uniref:ER to Golgi vesicle-mediated transport n=1 Tax=Didymella rabiei TaxID=5454 RepID=A0A162YKT5_DIDRA|nr:emp24p/erv25p- protein [Ascochyta rabiei]KZM20099.1 ER to Golgi vesicle-mediated transport [Ascochyta rabiei]UPX17105.1 emp24p/erv25p- protein [Ascochyta rabiei]
MWKPTVLLAAALAVPAQALHFFIDGAVQKCFFEELPKDTLVVGHYHAEVWDDATKSFQSKPDVGVFITVEETFDNNHRIVAQRGAGKGKFTFSAADSGQHRICVTPQNVQSGGWLGSGIHGSVKFTLDMAIGETSRIESTDKAHVQTLVEKVQDLNSRLQDVRREQIFQREREAEFRDQSESTNSRVVRWTLIQLAILGVTCAWQLTHLRAFFVKQKLV